MIVYRTIGPTLVIPKVVKSATKFLKNRFINKNLMPKNDLDLVFYMCKGGNPEILNLEFWQI